jgi:hypothetical protein
MIVPIWLLITLYLLAAVSTFMGVSGPQTNLARLGLSLIWPVLGVIALIMTFLDWGFEQ